MRAMFPKIRAARFPEIVGASTALAAISQFFRFRPRPRFSRKAARPEHQRERTEVSSSITARRRSSWQHRSASIPSTALYVEVVKPRLGRDPRQDINKEYDAAHMLRRIADRDLAGAGRQSIPFTVPAIETSTAGHQRSHEAQGQAAMPKDWKGMKVRPFPFELFDAQLSAALLSRRTRPRSPIPDVQLRSVPPAGMVAQTCAPTTLDGFLAPSLCFMAKRDALPVDVLDRRHRERIALAPAPARSRRHRRQHVRRVVFLVDGLVADHGPAGGFHHFDVKRAWNRSRAVLP